MALRITLDVFSGRPNPSVVVSGREEQELLGRVAPPPRARGAAAAARAPARPILGYRGVLLEPLDDAAAAAARAGRARVRRGAAREALRIPPGADPELEALLCNPAGPLRAAGLAPRLLDFVGGEVTRAREPVATRAATARATARAAARAAAPPCACAPLWEPGWWNDAGPIQAGNNCYNYAVDYRTDTYAQPGRANAFMYGVITCADVRAGALADALQAAPNRNKCPRRGHLVALVVSPWDFHWYRKQRSGMWTHKPGGSEVTDLDNANVAIADPRTADRGPYTTFCGFLIVMHGHVKIS